MASSDFLFCSVNFTFAEGLTHMVVRRRTHLLALWATWPTFGSQISVFSHDKWGPRTVCTPRDVLAMAVLVASL